MLEYIIQLRLDNGFGPIMFLLQFVFDLWQKKTGVMSPWNRTKNILHRDWLLNSHSESRERPNAIKGTYFESTFSFFLVWPKNQLSNQTWLRKWNSGQVIDFGYFTQIEHLICKVKSIFAITCLTKFGFNI